MPIRITLESALKNANMSARELARRVGCSKDTVVAYRHGRVRKIDLDLVEAFCAYLGCEIADVLTDQQAITVRQPSSRPAPDAQTSPAAPASPERQPKVTARMPRPTIAEFQTLTSRQKAGIFRPGDALPVGTRARCEEMLARGARQKWFIFPILFALK